MEPIKDMQENKLDKIKNEIEEILKDKNDSRIPEFW